ncbi:MAG: asparagine synthase (glutamine-hydrolyzing) [Chitinophagaceae bacterium]|nr:asparagine synthase (glutamine-hydrolyzing) [Chitinophagaceae bacterium]
MCGIAGIISPDTGLIDPQRLKKMSDALAHRGPDGEAVWINKNGTTGFAHRRLAVIDLSPAGAQPMHYPSAADARYTIVHNGEIYNYIELRETLQAKGYIFHSRSDTEVILAAYDCYKESCLNLFDGMFAFAIWDEQEQQLFAARDRFGEKPFFYHYDGNTLCFGSEMKALWAIKIEKRIDEQVLLYYLASGSVQSPVYKHRTFYRSIQSLPAAHSLVFSPAKNGIETKQWWNMDVNAKEYTEGEAIDRFRSLFSLSVKRRLRSDVPAGTNLSGGLDSASIAAVVKELAGSGNYNSFSVVFPGFEKDESKYIKEVTGSLHIPNFSISPAAGDFINDFEELCYHQELPFDSAGVYLQFALSRLAKQHNTKVLLDGQGADEILAGYTKYFHYYLQELIRGGSWRRFGNERKGLLSNNIHIKWGYKNYLAAFLPGVAASFLRKKEIRRLEHTDGEIEEDFLNEFLDDNMFFKPVVKGLHDILHYNAFQSGLEDLLRYADRNSMAFGRELRLPFLDHELVTFIFSLPAQYKIRNGYSKWILREAMKNSLPPSVTGRKDKTGFEPPQLQWMKAPAVQERIYACRKKLSEAGILKKSKVGIPVRPVTAYAADNMDWRYLVTGALLP